MHFYLLPMGIDPCPIFFRIEIAIEIGIVSPCSAGYRQLIRTKTKQRSVVAKAMSQQVFDSDRDFDSDWSSHGLILDGMYVIFFETWNYISI